MSETLKLAYLTNQYPKISHSFIRREILALEALGVEITRFSIRRAKENFPDPADRTELQRTTFLLDGGAVSLLGATLAAALVRPHSFLRALRMTLKMGLRSLRGPVRHLVYLAEAAKLQKLCHERGITHLHVHHATNPAVVALLCKMLGGPPYSLTVHGPEEFEQGNKLALNEKIAHAAFVTTVSEWSRGKLIEYCDTADAKKIHLVRNGIDDFFVSNLPTTVTGTPQLLWVGRMEKQKDPLMLVRAVKKLRAQNYSCAVTMIGDGSLRAAVEKEIQESGLTGTFTLKGWGNQAEILAHLRSARVLVLSSRSENVPSVIQESLAQARPVVSTRVGGVDELVQDGVTGWLVPPDSVEELARVLLYVLLTDPAQLQQMGQRGRQFILKNHSLTAHAAQLLALLDSASCQRN